MGWCSATQHVDDVWDAIKEFIPEESKPSVAAKICRSFEDGDWDCQDESEECYWVALNDTAYVRTKVRWFDDFNDFIEYASSRDFDDVSDVDDATKAKWLKVWNEAHD